MDLLATVRKEGSRGGQGDFKWADVQNSSRREHYLGHSLMAPVGRWQKGRDLNWYAKTDDSSSNSEDPAAKSARERKDEIKRIQEAEQDALARALGLSVPDRSNANLQPLGSRIDATSQRESRGDHSIGSQYEEEESADRTELRDALREYKRRHGADDKYSQADDRASSRRPRRSHREKRERSRERHRSYKSRSHNREPSQRRDPKTQDPSRGRNSRRSQSPYRSRHHGS